MKKIRKSNIAGEILFLLESSFCGRYSMWQVLTDLEYGKHMQCHPQSVCGIPLWK